MSLRLALVLPLMLNLTGCGGGEGEGESSGDDDGGGGGGGGSTLPGTASVDIVAADGGTVALGDASLEIPAGSLTADTTVTVGSSEPDASLPESDTVVGLVYDFGPDGTVFEPAATLELPLPVTPGTDEQAVISWLDVSSNAWVDLPSSVSGASISAPVEHFTSFAVRIILVNGTLGDCRFDGACGGDLLGTWTLDGFCFYVDPVTTQATDCISVEVTATITGSFTFNNDSTYDSQTTIEGQIDVILEGDCLPPLNSCSQLDGDMGGSCTGDPAVSCTCTSPVSEDGTDTGMWMTSGDILTIDEQETASETDPGPSDSEYCVNGSELQVHDLDDDTVVNAHR